MDGKENWMKTRKDIMMKRRKDNIKVGLSSSQSAVVGKCFYCAMVCILWELVVIKHYMVEKRISWQSPNNTKLKAIYIDGWVIVNTHVESEGFLLSNLKLRCCIYLLINVAFIAQLG